jgi:hypothetical protein
MPDYGGPYPLTVDPVDPGAVVRSILSGMMALNPVLRIDYPTLQVAVQHRKPVSVPRGLFLLLSLSPELHRRAAGGKAVRQDLWRGKVRKMVTTFNELEWAPLYLVLTDQSGREHWDGAQDVLPWINDAPGEVRSVNLLVPVIRPELIHTREIHGAAVVGRQDGMVAVLTQPGQDLWPTD